MSSNLWKSPIAGNAEIDLAEAANRIGGRYDGRRLTLKKLGKGFGVDSNGNFSSDIHVNPFVSAPFLEYVIYSKGVDPAGDVRKSVGKTCGLCEKLNLPNKGVRYPIQRIW